MPFGNWANWDACIADIGKKNPDYSDEQVKRVCGKLKEKLEKCTNQSAAYKAITRHLGESDIETEADVKKSWPHELQGILSSPRVAEMTFHVPKVDKDLEFITPGAMAGALKDYMKFPIISEFHKERPIGMAEKVWQTSTDEFKARIRIRDDPSTDDVWEKMNLPEGTPGRYDQVSIAGKRIVYSQECNIPLSMRKATNPCRTEKLRLDSVSVCDDRARNDGTELNVVKAVSDDQLQFVYTTSLDIKQVEHNLIKAQTTESELIHPVTDGANQPDLKKDHPATGTSTVKGGKMKKGTETKKTSDEDAQEPVEETEAKKGEEKEDTDPEKQVEKGMEQSEAHMTDQSTMLREILATLKQLVATDKQVHAEVGKAEEKPAEEKKEEKKEEMEKEEKSVKKAETEEDEKNIKKAAMEQDFQKALDAAVAPLRTEIDALKAEVQRLGDEPLYKAGVYLKELKVDKDGKPELGNAGMMAEQRKRTAGKKV